MKKLILFIFCFSFFHLTFTQNTFGPEHNITFNAGYLDKIFYFDVDGDEIEDLITFNEDNGELYWYKNFGEGNFVASQFLIDLNTEVLYTSDIDADNDIDFVYRYNEDIYWCSNDGNGTYSYEGALIVSGGYVKYFKLGDIDGDLDDDILLTFFPEPNASMLWYSNLGDGYFSTPNMISSGDMVFYNPRLTDIDSDGDLDILYILTVQNMPDDDYYLNLSINNGGSFSSFTIFFDYYILPYAVDITGDGFQEIITNDNNGSVWYENNGNNNFLIQHDLTYNLELNEIIAFDAEFDNDYDIFYSDWQTLWLENNNDGTFEDDYLLSYNGGIILNGDIDLDNDDDVIIANSSSITWVENTTFTAHLSENEFSEIMLFPNPANKFLFIESDTPTGLAEIINSTGVVVKNSNQTKIDISDLESNSYLVKIFDKQGNILKIDKLIIN